MLRKSAVIAISCLCLFSPSCDHARKQRAQKEALSEIKASKNEMLDSMEMTDEGLTVDMAKVEQARETLTKSGEKMGGKVGEALKIAAELQGDISKAGEKCIAITAEVSPYLDMESFSEKRNYAEGIEKFKEAITVNEAALAAFETLKPKLTKRLDEIGFTGQGRKDFEAGFQNQWGKTLALVKVVRNADIEISKIGIALMEGLKSGDSQWHWDKDAGQISLKTDEQVDWYDFHMQRILDLGEEQRKAQEKLISNMKAR